jgi:hypothetical protein
MKRSIVVYKLNYDKVENRKTIGANMNGIKTKRAETGARRLGLSRVQEMQF